MVEPMKVTLCFKDVDFSSKVSEFVRISSKVDTSVDVVSGRYRVDGQSIMGIFSLDLSQPFTVEVNPIEKPFIEEIKKVFADNVVEEA